MPSYIQYADVSSQEVAAELQTSDTLFKMDHELVGGANETIQGGCNISFDAFFDIELNIPELSFKDSSSDFDRSLFDKIDSLSSEVAMINDMLIDSIMDMECCDIAETYNSTLIPFFKFFADTEGKSVMDLLITMAEVITAIKAIVEALECLMPMLPGNPWLPKDIDVLSWIYGLWKESGPLLDKFFSGEYLDIIINPTHEIRTQLQACLGINDSVVSEFQNSSVVGTSAQMAKIALLASKSGNQLTRAAMLKPSKVAKPNPDDYRQGTGDFEFIKAMESFAKGILGYEKEVRIYDEIATTISKQTEIQKNINTNLAIATQTQYLVRASTDGLCGCVADVLGIKDVSIIPIPVKTSADMNKLIGKTINGVTNKQAGVASKDRPRKEPITIKPEDLSKNSVQKAVLNAGESKGNPKKCAKGSEVKTRTCPYTEAGIPYGRGTIASTCVLIDYNAVSGPVAIKDANDDKEKIQKDLRNDLMNNGSKTRISQDNLEAYWLGQKKNADKIIHAGDFSSVASVPVTTSNQIITEFAKIYSQDTSVAKYIYENMFGTYAPFDLDSDPRDSNFTSLWLTQDILDMMYTSLGRRGNARRTYISDLRQRAKDALPEDLRHIPFPSNTPPQNIINLLPLSTEVTVDNKKEISYFNAGFVREGNQFWRNFNMLDLEYSDETINLGAIQKDKTRSKYTAIFPNDEIGNAAQISYLRKTYIDQSINHIIERELITATEANINDVKSNLTYDTSDKIEVFNDIELIDITEAIATNNGYEKGRLWVRTRRVQDDVTFNSPEEEYTIGFKEDTFLNLTVKLNGVSRAITKEESQLLDIAYTLNATDPAQAMMKLSNLNLMARAKAYGTQMDLYQKEVSLHTALDGITASLGNSIASMVRTEIDIRIPCKCGSIICTVLNQVIQMLMSTLQTMVDQILAQIVEFMIPDWVKDLADLILEYVNCFLSMFGIPAKIAAVHEEAEQLRQDMLGRVRHYPADACFVPESVNATKPIESHQVSPEHFDYYPGPCTTTSPCDTCPNMSRVGRATTATIATTTEILEQEEQGPLLMSTIPSYGNQFPEVNSWDLPLYMTEPVSVIAGDLGRSTPGFKFNATEKQKEDYE